MNYETINSPEQLLDWKNNILRQKNEGPDAAFKVSVRIAMATCGIASGAKDTMNVLIEEAERQAIDVVVTQTGCMGFCYAEPTVEVTIPGRDPVVFGHVDKAKAREIIDHYVIQGKLIDGIIPVEFKTIND